jgi:hypothetical protein
MKLAAAGMAVVRIRRGDEVLYLGSITGEPPVADPAHARKFQSAADATAWLDAHPEIRGGQDAEPIPLAEATP